MQFWLCLVEGGRWINATGKEQNIFLISDHARCLTERIDFLDINSFVVQSPGVQVIASLQSSP